MVLLIPTDVAVLQVPPGSPPPELELLDEDEPELLDELDDDEPELLDDDEPELLDELGTTSKSVRPFPSYS